ncbi:class I SAM-dependent methyltransferase [Flindersiella endophytica]
MTTIVNTHQSEAWNGYEGRHWADNQERYDHGNEEFNTILFDAAGIGESDNVLDIGCGNGQTTRLAAQRAVNGNVLGVDLSVPMLTRARQLAEAEGLSNVTFERGDAQVFPFPAREFDVAISRFAIMFFADPVAAFGNIRQALRPGGRVAFLAMSAGPRNQLLPVFATVHKHVTVPEPQDQPAGTGPLSLAEATRVAEVFGAAGYTGVRSTPVEAGTWWGDDVHDARDFICGWGPVRHAFTFATQEQIDAVRAELAEALRPYETERGVWIRHTANLITAVNPDAR